MYSMTCDLNKDGYDCAEVIDTSLFATTNDVDPEPMSLSHIKDSINLSLSKRFSLHVVDNMDYLYNGTESTYGSVINMGIITDNLVDAMRSCNCDSDVVIEINNLMKGIPVDKALANFDMLVVDKIYNLNKDSNEDLD